MRKVSAKRRQLLTWLAPKRATYVASRLCVVSRLPGRWARKATDCHEIVGGRHRQTTERDERFWLAVERMNHDELQNMPKAMQWALKVLYDAEHFDIAALSELPGSVVTAAEVLEQVKAILCGGEEVEREARGM